MDIVVAQEAQKKKSRLPLALSCLLLGILAAGYTGLCAYAANNGLLWKNTRVLGQDLSGLTVSQAAKKLEQAFPTMKIGVYLYDGGAGGVPERAKSPDAYVSLSDLGAEADLSTLARSAHERNLRGGMFTLGWRYLTNTGAFCDVADLISLDGEKTRAAAEAAAAELSFPSRDTSYELGDSALLIHMAEDGRIMDAQAL